MVASAAQSAKRAFVTVLLRLAGKYHVDVPVTRESGDTEVEAALGPLSEAEAARPGLPVWRVFFCACNHASLAAFKRCESSSLYL